MRHVYVLTNLYADYSGDEDTRVVTYVFGKAEDAIAEWRKQCEDYINEYLGGNDLEETEKEDHFQQELLTGEISFEDCGMTQNAVRGYSHYSVMNDYHKQIYITKETLL